MTSLYTLTYKKTTWHNVLSPDEDAIDFLRQQYHFDNLNLMDSKATVQAQRPKLDPHVDYLFVILQFPFYDKNSRQIISAEIDFYLGKEFVVTLHNDQLKSLREFYRLCEDFSHYQKKYLENPSRLFYEILTRLFEESFRMTDHISEDITTIKNEIFAGQEKAMVRELLLMKNNIASFRRILQGQKLLIKKIMAVSPQLLDPEHTASYYHKLTETIDDLWDILETEREMVDAMQATNESSLSFKLNDIMKTLTIFSVVVFPLTLIAAIFGMNTRTLPFVGQPGDFYFIIALMLVLTLLMFLYFKRKRWIQ